MKTLDFNRGWQFHKVSDEVWSYVDLPHDAMLHEERSKDSATAGACAYFREGKYEYKKIFLAPEEWTDQTLILEFEGVYQKATVYLNGDEIGRNAYGYSNFFIDLTNKLNPSEENEILVVADNSMAPNSRWYSGSGIYREVKLHVGGTNAFLPDGIRIRTSENKLVYIEADTYLPINTETDKIMAEILYDGSVIASGCVGLEGIAVENPNLWSDASPCLYQCRVQLFSENSLVDEKTVSFGFRTVEVTNEGLLINGQSVLLQGGCIHHDNGILGACCFADAEERRVRLMKEAGFNAIRSSHNPASKAMLDACDRLGMFLIDETFDMWLIHKNPYDYADQDFKENWKKDTRAMIYKDYNHPCVLMYSIGNEISELGISEGQAMCKEISDYVHELDQTRPVTAGVNLMLAMMAAKGNGLYGSKDGKDKGTGSQSMDSMPTSAVFNMFMNKMGGIMDKMSSSSGANKAAEAVAPLLDIPGYNYATSRYKKECIANPERVIVGSETLPKSLYKNWQLVKEYPNLIGDFMWTAIDYLGESGIGTIRYTDKKTKKDIDDGLIISGGCGVIDICGKKRPEVYWNRSIWDLEEKPVIAVEPYTHVHDGRVASMWRDTDAVESWSWEGCEGDKSQVVVYTNQDSVVLGINGKKIARAKVKGCKAIFRNVPYEAGRITAVTYDAAGNKTGQNRLLTGTGKTMIKLSPEKTTLRANGQDLCFLNIDLVGENGITKSASDQKLEISIEGNGTLQAFGSARPNMAETFTGTVHTTYYGKALAVIRAGYESGTVKVTVKGDNLPELSQIIQID